MNDSKTKPQEPSATPEDQIDFGPIFRLIHRFFSGISRNVSAWGQLLKKKKKIFWTCILLGIGLGVGLKFILKDVYGSEMTIASNSLSNGICFDRVNNLQQMLKENSIDYFSETLQLPMEDAELVRNVEYLNLDIELETEDTILQNQFFTIRVEVYDNKVLPKLEKALVSYLENNQYARDRLVLEKEKLDKMIGKLQHEINELDTLKKLVANSLVPHGDGKNPGFIYGEPIDPVNVYREGINLYIKELDLTNQLELIKNIEVVVSFTPFFKPIFPKLSLTVGFGFGLGLIIALFLIGTPKSTATSQD